MDIKTLTTMVHDVAKEKGWWDKEVNPLAAIALVHSELSEAVEEIRKDNPPIYQVQSFLTGSVYGVVTPASHSTVLPTSALWNPELKPEGELIELADAVIRIMDYCGSKGYNLEEAILLKHAFNKTRSYRHGGKKF